MFNIDFDDKRVKSTLRTLQYSALTVLVVMGTVILVFAGQGYDFNTETRQVIRNGLILVNSTPEDANVYIDGELENDLTPSRFSVPDGEYRVSIWQEGYRDWNKTISVTGSAVEWLYYPLLIPAQLVTRNLTALLNPQFVGVSPSGEQLLVRQTSKEPVFTLLTHNSAGVSNEQRLVLPRGLLDLGDGSTIGNFGFEGWAGDNRHVLITHTLGRQVEYLLLDIEQITQSRNLTVDFDLPLRDVRFIDGDSQLLYTVVDSDLRRMDLESATISAPIARDVGRYVLYQDRFVVYVADTGSGGSQLGLIENDDEPRILLELAQPSQNYRLEFAEFDDIFYLALLDIAAGQMSLLTNPNLPELGTAQAPLVFNLEGAKYLTFSRNGQFVTIQSGQKFLTFDLDRRRRYAFGVDFKIGANDQARWLDGYRLQLSDQDGLLHMFEFDGGNPTDLLPVHNQFEPIINSGQNTLYTFTTPAEGGRVFLQGTLLTIPEN